MFFKLLPLNVSVLPITKLTYVGQLTCQKTHLIRSRFISWLKSRVFSA